MAVVGERGVDVGGIEWVIGCYWRLRGGDWWVIGWYTVTNHSNWVI